MKKEFGKWLMDIAKYMTTVMLLSSLFDIVDKGTWYIFFSIILAVFITLGLGLWLLKEKEENK